MGRVAVLCAFFCLVALPARADLASGRQAFQSGDYATALGELRPLADQGNGDAAFLLGRMAEHGWGMPASDAEAWRAYKRAADAGLPEAMLSAGDFADLGRGTPADHRLAYELYKRAADAGSARGRGRMGEMALDGRGRKVNTAEAVAWLRQAAMEDDPEALFLLDGLAARGLAASLPAGSASPAEGPARRVLDEARGVLSAMAGILVVNGEPGAVTRPDGSVLVTLPEVSAAGEAATYRLGTIRLVFRDIAADTARLAILLPSQVTAATAEGAPAGSLSVSGQRLSGLWSFSLHGFTEWRGEAAAASLDLANGAGLRLQGLSYERRLSGQGGQRFTVAEAASAANAALRFAIAGQSFTLAARRANWRAELPELDLAAYRRWADASRFDWRVGSMALHLLAAGQAGSPSRGVSADATGTLMVDGLSYDRDGRTVLAAEHLEGALALAELDRPKAAAHLSYAYDGLRLPAARYLPAGLDGSLSCEGLPAGQASEILRAAAAQIVEAALAPPGMTQLAPEGAVSGAMDELLAALAAAGTRIHLQDTAATGPGWDATAKGRVVPANGGMTVAIDAAVHGLDGFLAAGKDLGRSAVQTLRESAGAGADEKGRPTSLFQVAVPAGGRPLVNGRPLTIDGW